MSHSHTVRRRVVVVFVLTALLIAGVPITTGQESGTVTLDFAAYEGNPIIPRGAEGEWDAYVLWPRVVYHDGLFHMFYVGSDKAFDIGVSQIGYASSEDGLNWTKYEGNPVLSLDPAAAPNGTGSVGVYVENDTWVMLVTPRLGPGYRSVFHVQRATAPAPTGPWEVEEGILFERGSGADYDAAAFWLYSLVRTTEGFHVYYGPTEVGLLTSPDGITWTRYNDPETTQRIYRNSDPVLGAGESGRWDDGFVFDATVWTDGDGWHMIYNGGPSEGPENGASNGFGYATSEDGISWTRHGDAPFFSLSPDFGFGNPSLVMVGDTYYLYYNYSPWDNFRESETGVATGTITRN